jgi:hypothetical protein
MAIWSRTVNIFIDLDSSDHRSVLENLFQGGFFWLAVIIDAVAVSQFDHVVLSGLCQVAIDRQVKQDQFCN